VITWAIQTQLTLQIIINRTALLIEDKQKVSKIKWSVAALVGLVNISVFCIWIPSSLQISPRYRQINAIWDRIEKVIFLLVDGGLNLFFLYLVKSRLISQGLEQYRLLFNFNACMVVVSLTMDVSQLVYLPIHSIFLLTCPFQVLIIGMMDLKNNFV
jgi:hypothetical protein